MDVITLDFETFYSREYSLSKLSVEEYVNSPEFEVIGVSVKVNASPAVWCSGDEYEIQEWLQQFDFNNAWVGGHNFVFDYTILNWRFGIRPKRVFDTLSMARAVHGTEVGGSLKALAQHYKIGEKGTEVLNALGKRREDFTERELFNYAEYCKLDTELTYKLFCKLAMKFNKQEMRLIDMTLRMFVEPKLELATKVLEDSLSEIKFKKVQALSECGVTKEELMSNNKFAEVLRSLGVSPPTKVSKTTGKDTYAFAKKDKDLLDLLDHPDIKVQTVVSSRLQVKETLEETKTQRLIEVANRMHNKLPVGLKYYGAEVSGRWSAGGDGGALQLQNVARNSRIKEAIVAPKGYKIIGVDLSNIEVRVNLYIAGQQDQLDIIISGLDMYKDFGSKVFKTPYDDISKVQRFISKTAVLGLGFGAGAAVLCDAINLGAKTFGFEVDVDYAEAKRIVDLYREVNYKVKDAWKVGEKVLEAVKNGQYFDYNPGLLSLPVRGSNGIELPSGMFIKYNNLRKETADTLNGKEWIYDGRRGAKKRIYGPKVLQNCTQSVARCVMGEAMVRINAKYPIQLTVHDSCYTVVKEEEAQEAYDFIMREITVPPSWAPGLPLAAEGGIGDNIKQCG